MYYKQLSVISIINESALIFLINRLVHKMSMNISRAQGKVFKCLFVFFLNQTAPKSRDIQLNVKTSKYSQLRSKGWTFFNEQMS